MADEKDASKTPPASEVGAADASPVPSEKAPESASPTAPPAAAEEASPAATSTAAPEAAATQDLGRAARRDTLADDLAAERGAPQAVAPEGPERDAAPAPAVEGEDDAPDVATPPMPSTRAKAARTLSSLDISEKTPLAPDPARPTAVAEPTPMALRLVCLSWAAGLALGIAALLFASPVNAWVGLGAFAALMLLTLAPARLIAVTRSKGRTIVGWIAVWAMTIAGAIALALVAAAAQSDAGPRAVEPLARVAALLALAGLTLAPVLRGVWSLRIARFVAALFAVWAAAEAALIGVAGALTSPDAAGALFFDPNAPVPEELRDAVLAVGSYAGLVWPHAALLMTIPAILALRAPGGSFLIAAALFGAAGWVAARVTMTPSDDVGLYYETVDGVRRLLGACILAAPSVAVAALAASDRAIRPNLVRLLAAALFCALLAADIWTFVGAPLSVSAAGGSGAASGLTVPVSRGSLDFIRGVGAIAFLGATLLGALWFAGLAAFGRRAA